MKKGCAIDIHAPPVDSRVDDFDGEGEASKLTRTPSVGWLCNSKATYRSSINGDVHVKAYKRPMKLAAHLDRCC